MEIQLALSPLERVKQFIIQNPDCENSVRLWLNLRKADKEMESLGTKLERNATTDNERPAS